MLHKDKPQLHWIDFEKQGLPFSHLKTEIEIPFITYLCQNRSMHLAHQSWLFLAKARLTWSKIGLKDSAILIHKCVWKLDKYVQIGIMPPHVDCALIYWC